MVEAGETVRASRRRGMTRRCPSVGRIGNAGRGRSHTRHPACGGMGHGVTPARRWRAHGHARTEADTDRLEPRRVMDLVLGSFAFAASLPILAAMAVWMQLSGDHGAFLYRARRVGAGGSTIRVLKIRTMREGATGAGLTSTDDPRITPVGRAIRRYRIDELPQLRERRRRRDVAGRAPAGGSALRRPGRSAPSARLQRAARHHRSDPDPLPRRGGPAGRLGRSGPPVPRGDPAGEAPDGRRVPRPTDGPERPRASCGSLRVLLGRSVARRRAERTGRLAGAPSRCQATGIDVVAQRRASSPRARVGRRTPRTHHRGPTIRPGRRCRSRRRSRSGARAPGASAWTVSTVTSIAIASDHDDDLGAGTAAAARWPPRAGSGAARSGCCC